MFYKQICLIFCLFLGFSAFAQDAQRVDQIITLYPKQLENPEQLAAFISRDFSHPQDKLRAIYGWIIQNIEYDPQEYKALDYNFTTVKERNKKQSKFREQLIDRVLDKGVAVCEGYAMLFERLCELQDIQSYLVRGDTKASLSDIARDFNTSHMWNIAFIDNNPYLFDPTWGAGRYNEQGFVKDPTYRYFMAPPQRFIRTHYPVDYTDTLLEDVISKDAFLRAPILIDKDIINATNLLPAQGVLSSMEVAGAWQFNVPYPEEVKVSYSFGDQINSLGNITPEDLQLQFNIPVRIGVEFLIVYFNDSPGLAYLIK